MPDIVDPFDAPSKSGIVDPFEAGSSASAPVAAQQPDRPKPNLMSLLSRIPGSGIVTGPAEALAQLASGAVAKPVSDVAGLAAMAKDAITGKPGDAEGFKNEVQRNLTYEPRTDAGRLTSKYNPLALLGKATNWLGQKAEDHVAPPGSSTQQKMVGAGVKEAINQLPQFLGVPLAKGAGAAESALKSSARDSMMSALKPTVQAVRTGKAANAVETMLDKGINVSPGGVRKMQGRIAELNDNIKSLIQNSPAIVDKTAVAARIQPLFTKFTKQVNATDDLAAIQKSYDDFVNHPLLNGPDMPVQLAQEIKQGTYRSLGDKSYGELKSASIEAQKALARGLKEEIVKAVPEVKPLNEEESALLNALSVSERKVMMEASKNPAGLGWITTNPIKFAGFMADRSALFKSLIARMLNRSADAMPGAKKTSPLASYGIGQYANQPASADQDQ